MTLASPCFSSECTYDFEHLKKLKGLKLEDKILYSTVKIKEFYLENKGKIYVSFSGGKDSTVLLHLVRSIYPDTPGVFFDTGLEFPEIRKFVKTHENVEFVRPSMNFKQVIAEYGYPCIGKEAAHWIDLAQRGQPSGIRQMNMDSRFGFKKFNFMVDAPFRVSEKCCDVMKKKPAHEYYKTTGRAPIIGTRIDESRARETQFLKYGENRTTAGMPTSNPLSIWTDDDVEKYIYIYNLQICELYHQGYNRTGCAFCMFGIMSDRNRFVKLKASHPKLHKFCMRSVEDGGLGMKEVLEYMGIPTGCEQKNLLEYSDE